MRGNTPSLDIVRPVTNIGREELSGVQETLVDDHASEEERQRLRKLFKRPDLLNAHLINHAELLRLQRYSGWLSAVTDMHLEELTEYMHSALPDFSQKPADAPTLPAEMRPTLSQKGNFILKIANSQELVHERLFAKQALCNFYRVKGELPQRVWSDDSDTTGVWLATSSDDQASDLLQKVDWALEVMPELLPEVTCFDPVKVVKRLGS